MFGRNSRQQQPSEAFAAEEQNRGEGLARRIERIASDPKNPSRGSLPLYRMADRDALGNAAA
ncbi:MAG: hypothetical protein JO362_21820, partial [Streptomycetaceae bacterium]|nr:hypothetical protein [Streptomycetaceae bacterium]